MKNDTNYRIEFPAVGSTYAYNEYVVYEYGVYPHTSVLAGQARRIFIDSFASLEAARDAYPGAAEEIGEPIAEEVY